MLSNNRLVLEPMASSSPGETHAAMVVSQQSFTDVNFSADFSTLKQLRTGSAPNPWETAWAVFNHTDDDHFYYVAFKINGWELGKVDPAYPGGQRYLDTGNLPKSPIGTEHRFDIQVNGATIKVILDGEVLTTFTDTERPYLSGSIGFYTEDARVAFDNVTGSLTDNFENYPAQTLSDGASIGTTWEVEYLGYGTGALTTLDGATTPTPQPPTTLKGTPSDDSIAGDDLDNLIFGKGGSDTLNGRGADDTIHGGAGADQMSGGDGYDTFVFSSVRHAVGDEIVDWTEQDTLDFRVIDAISRSATDDAFEFIGQAQFTAAGQLHYTKDVTTGVTYIEGNVDNDLAADFRIHLQGLFDLDGLDLL